jgi:hypothetical protein
MTQFNSSSQTETYAYTRDTTKVTVVPRIITQSEQIARYFTEDLVEFVKQANIDLMRELEIPPEYARNTDEVVWMLFDDISHMLRDGLITGVHLLLSEPKIDPNSHAYPLRYHAMYTINNPERSLRKPSDTLRRFNGFLAPPRNVWIGARFALLIDWNASANQRRRQAHRPEYCFDWVPEQSRFDETSLIRYREGRMTFEAATVNRAEFKSPGF